MRAFYLVGGLVALALGFVGVFLPLLPTVPFVLLAAFCFARSNPAWEQRILDHPRFGPPIRAWRERGSISRYAKVAAVVSLAISAGVGPWALASPWCYAPATVAVLTSSWILTRPTT